MCKEVLSYALVSLMIRGWGEYTHLSSSTMYTVNVWIKMTYLKMHRAIFITLQWYHNKAFVSEDTFNKKNTNLFYKFLKPRF